MAKLDVEEILLKNQRITITASELKDMQNGIPLAIYVSKTDTITIDCDGTTTGLRKMKDLHKHHQETIKDELPKKRRYHRTGEYTKEKRDKARAIAQENREARERKLKRKGKDAKDISKIAKERTALKRNNAKKNTV